jgi:hypothetical protein
MPRMCRAVIAAFAALCGLTASGTALGQPSPPQEFWSGIELPLLPGERYVPLPNGCGLIENEGQQPSADYTSLRWEGACRYGLVHGAGFWNYFDTANGKWTGLTMPLALPMMGGFYLGRGIPVATANYVGLPVHYRRTESVGLQLQPDPRPYTQAEAERAANWSLGADVFDRGGKLSSRLLASKITASPTSEVAEYVWLYKNYCKTDIDIPDLRTNIYKYSLDKDLLGFLVLETDIVTAGRKKITEALRPFCANAVARRTGGTGRGDLGRPDEIFANVDYGYWHAVVTTRSVIPRQADGTRGSETRSVDIGLCPVLGDISSCETVWRTVLAPYKAELAQLRPLVEQERRALMVQLDELHAPLEAAIRAKARELAGR